MVGSDSCEAGVSSIGAGTRALGHAAATCVALLLVASPCPAAPDGVTTRASLDSAGRQATGLSSEASISADGEVVAFSSVAPDLVPGDTNGVRDVFVHFRSTGETRRVSVSSTGAQGTAESSGPSLSADGRFVAFASSAPNLVPGDTNAFSDVFLHDLRTGETARISISTTGEEGNYPSRAPAVSGNGRYVAFESRASNFAVTDATIDVFVRDRATGETRLVSRSSSHEPGNDDSYTASISSNGRFVAFVSSADNLVPGDSNDRQDVFMHDRETGQTQRMSVSSTGAEGSGDSLMGAISADGLTVAFASASPELVPGDTNGVIDVFLHDRASGTTVRASVSSTGAQGAGPSTLPSLSSDGRYVAFASTSANLVPGDTNGQADVFLHDRLTGGTSRVSLSAAGGQAAGICSRPKLSGEARFVAFESGAANLVPDDTNGSYEVFLRDRECDGNVSVYCDAQTNSAGCTPTISAAGVPSASAGVGFTIAARGVLANQSGVFFYGTSGAANVPFQGGTVCMQAPQVRLPVQVSSGSPPCNGLFTFDFNAWTATGADPRLVPGRTVWGQWWSRDPGSPLGGTNLTDALRFTLCP